MRMHAFACTYMHVDACGCICMHENAYAFMCMNKHAASPSHKPQACETLTPAGGGSKPGATFVMLYYVICQCFCRNVEICKY